MSATLAMTATFSTGVQGENTVISPRGSQDYSFVFYVLPLSEPLRTRMVDGMRESCDSRMDGRWEVWNCGLPSRVKRDPSTVKRDVYHIISDTEMVTLELVMADYYPEEHHQGCREFLADMVDRVVERHG